MDLVTFTNEIFEGMLHFLRSVFSWEYYFQEHLRVIFINVIGLSDKSLEGVHRTSQHKCYKR